MKIFDVKIVINVKSKPKVTNRNMKFEIVFIQRHNLLIRSISALDFMHLLMKPHFLPFDLVLFLDCSFQIEIFIELKIPKPQ